MIGGENQSRGGGEGGSETGVEGARWSVAGAQHHIQVGRVVDHKGVEHKGRVLRDLRSGESWNKATVKTYFVY